MNGEPLYVSRPDRAGVSTVHRPERDGYGVRTAGELIGRIYRPDTDLTGYVAAAAGSLARPAFKRQRDAVAWIEETAR